MNYPTVSCEVSLMVQLTPDPSLGKRGEAPQCPIPTKRFSRGEFRWSKEKGTSTQQQAARNSVELKPSEDEKAAIARFFDAGGYI